MDKQEREQIERLRAKIVAERAAEAKRLEDLKSGNSVSQSTVFADMTPKEIKLGEKKARLTEVNVEIANIKPKASGKAGDDGNPTGDPDKTLTSREKWEAAVAAGKMSKKGVVENPEIALIKNATSFEELYAILDKVKEIQESDKIYTYIELWKQIEKARNTWPDAKKKGVPISTFLALFTNTGNLRDKIAELLEKESEPETIIPIKPSEGKLISNLDSKNIFCPKCGSSLPAKAGFCGFCGFIIPKQEVIEERQEIIEVPNIAPDEKEKPDVQSKIEQAKILGAIPNLVEEKTPKEIEFEEEKGGTSAPKSLPESEAFIEDLMNRAIRKQGGEMPKAKEALMERVIENPDLVAPQMPEISESGAVSNKVEAEVDEASSNETEVNQPKMERVLDDGPLERIKKKSLISYQGENYTVTEIPKKKNGNKYILVHPSGKPIYKLTAEQLTAQIESGAAKLVSPTEKEIVEEKIESDVSNLIDNVFKIKTLEKPKIVRSEENIEVERKRVEAIEKLETILAQATKRLAEIDEELAKMPPEDEKTETVSSASAEDQNQEALEKDKKKNPLKYFLIDKIHPKNFEVMFGVKKDKISVEDTNFMIEQSGEDLKEVSFWNQNYINAEKDYSICISSNGFYLRLKNMEEVRDKDGAIIIDNEKARYDLVGPDGEVVEANISYERTQNIFYGKAQEYQEVQLFKFENEIESKEIESIPKEQRREFFETRRVERIYNIEKIKWDINYYTEGLAAEYEGEREHAKKTLDEIKASPLKYYTKSLEFYSEEHMPGEHYRGTENEFRRVVNLINAINDRYDELIANLEK